MEGHLCTKWGGLHVPLLKLLLPCFHGNRALVRYRPRFLLLLLPPPPQPRLPRSMPPSSSSSTNSTTAAAHSSLDTAAGLNQERPPLRAPVVLEAEIVSEEEMAFIEAALASTRSILTSSRTTTTPLSRYSTSCSFSSVSRDFQAQSVVAEIPHVEECCSGTTQGGGKGRLPLPMRALAVTKLTSVEWCEKQVEFTILHGKPEATVAMKAGSDRHRELEEQVIQRVDIYDIHSEEDHWALKFLNFIFGVNQLLLDGLTRELPVIGLVEGEWVTGIIDELRLNLAASNTSPLLIDIKTRKSARLPSGAQKRNARLQLMCYKYLWDYNVADRFDIDKFLEHFDLNPKTLLADGLVQYSASLGFQIKTFQDVLVHFTRVSQLLSRSDDQMVLRYEYQEDKSLLGEYLFEFDCHWFKAQVQRCIEFLRGNREASYVPDDERFKCSYCPFASKCPRVTGP